MGQTLHMRVQNIRCLSKMSSDKENVAPGKKRRLSLSLSKKQKRGFDETSLEEIAALEKPHMAKNTEVSSKWAMKDLTEWFLDYNKRNPDLPCPESILTSSPSKEELSKFLTIFIAETRNQNGEKYPPRTVYALLSRIMVAENPQYPCKSDPAFKTFLTAMDNLFKKLKSGGVGADAKHTEAISAEEEKQC